LSLEEGQKIAQAILQAQMIAREIPPATIGGDGKIELKEQPRPLSYYYRPHKYKTVEPGTHEIIYDFNVPGNRVFHIHQVANNWFRDTFSEWKLDGVRLEKVERWISSINSPLVIKDRFLVAYHNVKWITYNNSDSAIISEALLDGLVWALPDWLKVRGRY